MENSRPFYHLNSISGFNSLLLHDANNKDEDESETNLFQMCKTKVITKNNEEYTMVRYDKHLLTFDSIQTNGLLRSVILKNNKLVCFSPPKSIPWDTFVKVDTDPRNKYNHSIVAEEFVEGIMINVFWDETNGLSGCWELATGSNIGGNVSFYKNTKTIRAMFLEAIAVHEFDLNRLSKQYCYTFVLQHPADNRIVTPIKTPVLYLVDVFEIINAHDGSMIVFPVNLQEVKFFPEFESSTIQFPEIYEWSSYDELKERFACANTPYKTMGVVVRNLLTGSRTKLRNPVYEMVRQLRCNQPKLQYHYLCLRKDGKVSDYLQFYPEHKKDFALFRKDLHEYTQTLYNNYVNCYIHKDKQLKDYPENFRTHMFHLHVKYREELKPKHLYINNTEVIQYVNSMPTTLLMYSLNYGMRQRRADVMSLSFTNE